MQPSYIYISGICGVIERFFFRMPGKCFIQSGNVRWCGMVYDCLTSAKQFCLSWQEIRMILKVSNNYLWQSDIDRLARAHKKQTQFEERGKIKGAGRVSKYNIPLSTQLSLLLPCRTGKQHMPSCHVWYDAARCYRESNCGPRSPESIVIELPFKVARFISAGWRCCQDIVRIIHQSSYTFTNYKIDCALKYNIQEYMNDLRCNCIFTYLSLAKWQQKLPPV